MIDFSKEYIEGENETHPPTYLKTHLTAALVSDNSSRHLQGGYVIYKGQWTVLTSRRKVSVHDKTIGIGYSRARLKQYRFSRLSASVEYNSLCLYLAGPKKGMRC